MRILSGQYKGKELYAGKDLSIRPATNKIKEIIFAVLGDFFVNKNVLDMFCGSGNLGIEALSRGAATITFVENSESSIRILKNNISRLKLDLSKIYIIKKDAINFSLSTEDSFELMLVDPPFKYSSLQALVDNLVLRDILHQDGILMIHHEYTNPIQSNIGFYEIIKQKRVGRSLLTFIIRRDTNA